MASNPQKINDVSVWVESSSTIAFGVMNTIKTVDAGVWSGVGRSSFKCW